MLVFSVSLPSGIGIVSTVVVVVGIVSKIVGGIDFNIRVGIVRAGTEVSVFFNVSIVVVCIVRIVVVVNIFVGSICILGIVVVGIGIAMVGIGVIDIVNRRYRYR